MHARISSDSWTRLLRMQRTWTNIQNMLLVLLHQKLVSSGGNFRATLKKRCVEGTGHERGPDGAVWRLCRGACRSDRARGSNGAVAGLLPRLAAAGRA